VTRVSLYDRISEKRLALEAQARLAEQAAPVVEAPPEPEPEPAAPLQDTPSSFNFGGFNLAFPAGSQFRDIRATIEHGDVPVTLTIRRRDVRQDQTLPQLFQEAVQVFRDSYADLRVIRERDCKVAGNPAMALDFNFKVGLGERHGRFVGALVAVSGGDEKQWLDISCEIDPTLPGLSLFLTEFDEMLDGLTSR
jgi:hypothetical protein